MHSKYDSRAACLCVHMHAAHYLCYGRYVNSAVTRAGGPTDDHMSGQDFTVRVVGRSSKASGSPAKPAAAPAAQNVDGSESASEPGSADEQMEGTDIMEAMTVSHGSLAKAVGQEAANDISKIVFQHNARSTAPAQHLKTGEFVIYTPSERAAPRPWRKAQLHPSVPFRLIESVFGSNNKKIEANEAFVVLGASTQESVVASVSHGFKQVDLIWDTCHMSTKGFWLLINFIRGVTLIIKNIGSLCWWYCASNCGLLAYQSLAECVPDSGYAMHILLPGFARRPERGHSYAHPPHGRARDAGEDQLWEIRFAGRGQRYARLARCPYRARCRDKPIRPCQTHRESDGSRAIT